MSASNEFPAGSAADHSPQPCTAWFGELDQVDFDLDFYQRIVDRNPNYVQVLRCLGELLARKGFYERSLPVDRRLVTLLPDDGVARYNLACSLSMCGETRAAIEQLSQAIDHGYHDFGHLEVDPDLDSLRNDPAYVALLRQHGCGR